MGIKKYNFLQSLIAIVALAVIGKESCFAAEADNLARPNIILCMSDNQGWQDTGYNGHPILKTPNLDAMAAEGIRFDRFYAGAAICSPTRASMLTGRDANRMAVYSYGLAMRPQETTIAEALKQSGYVTGHFGKWHVGSIQKGSPVNPGSSGFDEWVSAPNYFDTNPILSHQGVAVKHKGESSEVAIEVALEFIREQSKTPEPFLAVIWLAAPHVPYHASKEDLEPYLSQGKWAGYLAEIAALDRAFGKLRSEIKKIGIRDDTILWFNSDNGGLNPEWGGGRVSKGRSLVYEGTLRIPSIMEWPARFPKPQVINTPCSTTDMYPTLLDITGTTVEGQFPLDGISLMPYLEGTETARSKPMGFWQMPGKGKITNGKQEMTRILRAQAEGKEIDDKSSLDLDAAEIKVQLPEDDIKGQAAWLDWPWKLHRIKSKKGIVTFELYNLEEDAYEENNLVKLQPERVNAMKIKLEAWQRSVIRSHNGHDYK